MVHLERSAWTSKAVMMRRSSPRINRDQALRGTHSSFGLRGELQGTKAEWLIGGRGWLLQRDEANRLLSWAAGSSCK